MAKSKEKEQTLQSAQDFIGIKDIQGGLIIMENGQILKIFEILPINFGEKSAAEQNAGLAGFAWGLSSGPIRGHIKVMHSHFDLQPFIQNVRKITQYERNPELRQRVEDYLLGVINIQKNSIRNRFFYIFEYEGDEDGKKSTKFEEIYEQMDMVGQAAKAALAAAGNYVLDYGAAGDWSSLYEIYYEYFNPTSKGSQTIEDRRKHLAKAMWYVREEEGDDTIVPPLDDIVAPRGLMFCPFDYLIMDNTYITYLVLQSNKFPTMVEPGVMVQSLLASRDSALGYDADVDIYYEEQPDELTKYKLERFSVIRKGLAEVDQIGENKQRQLENQARNTEYMKKAMDENEEKFYKVCLIVTLRADSKEELYRIRKRYMREKSSYGYKFNTSFLHTQEIFAMVQPFMKLDEKIFNYENRNFMTSSLPAIYCFSSFEMFNNNGCCMGNIIKDGRAGSLFSFDPFDTNRFPNPHIFLLGTSGAGKTFTEMMIFSRMRMHGIWTMMVLPLKGFEYEACIKSLGGEFIRLRPGGKACINIMGIEPESADVNSTEKQPLLAKQIKTVSTFLSILYGQDRLTIDEQGELNAVLTTVYNRYGITTNDNSIYEDEEHTRVRTMPTLGDLYDAMRANPVLAPRASALRAWVSGSSSNFNGQTNVNLNNMCIAFDVDEEAIGRNDLPAYMYIAFNHCYARAKRDRTEKCAIALDEVWKMLSVKETAEQVKEMIKILRGYGTSVICATQDFRDCLGNEYGQALLSNSAIKMILRMQPEEIPYVQKAETIQLSQNNIDNITTFEKGGAYFCYGREKVRVHLEATQKEFELYNTDVNTLNKRRQSKF